jgi:hypothetical protein
MLSKNLKFKVHRTIILPVVLYRHETWSLTLRKGHRLKVSENRMLRRMFVLKRDEVIGGWSKLHNEKLHNLYFLQNIIRVTKPRKMRWV